MADGTSTSAGRHGPDSQKVLALKRALRALGPAMPRPRWREILRSALGAGAALLLCGGFILLLAKEVTMTSAGGLFLIGPLGATSFLLIAVPNSPLSQPWSAVVGNTLSALTAVAVLSLGMPTILSASIAVAAAILVMSLARALHPPGSAVALSTVLTSAVFGDIGVGYAFAPVMVDTMMLVLIAIAFNRVTGRRYPFRQAASPGPGGTGDVAPARRLGLSADDLSALLARFNQSANIGAEDLARILAAAEAEAASRRFGKGTCGDIMSRDLVTVRPDTRLSVVADLFRKHRFKTLPVTDEEGALLGIITQNDLIQRAREDALAHRNSFAAAMSLLAGATTREAPRAASIMTSPARTVRPETTVGELIPFLADEGVQAAPVVRGPHLVGVVTRSDLIAFLARQSLTR